jgi:hypothetical protein
VVAEGVEDERTLAEEERCGVPVARGRQRGCGLLVATYEGRQVRYTWPTHTCSALTELVKVVLAVDTAEPCLNNDHDHDDQPVTAAVEAGR